LEFLTFFFFFPFLWLGHLAVLGHWPVNFFPQQSGQFEDFVGALIPGKHSAFKQTFVFLGDPRLEKNTGGFSAPQPLPPVFAKKKRGILSRFGILPGNKKEFF